MHKDVMPCHAKWIPKAGDGLRQIPYGRPTAAEGGGTNEKVEIGSIWAVGVPVVEICRWQRGGSGEDWKWAVWRELGRLEFRVLR